MNKSIKLVLIFMLVLVGLSPILKNIHATSEDEADIENMSATSEDEKDIGNMPITSEDEMDIENMSETSEDEKDIGNMPITSEDETDIENMSETNDDGRMTTGFMTSPPASDVPLEDVFSAIGHAYVDSEYPGTVVITENKTVQLGALWTAGKIDLTNPFTYKSYIYWGRSQDSPMGSNNEQAGGDGMTITMHNDPRGINAIGGQGGGLGSYKRPTIATDIPISNGLSYEIDPYINNYVTEFDAGMLINNLEPDLVRHMAFVKPDDPIGIDKHMELSSFQSKDVRESEWNELNINWEPNESGSGEITITVNGHPSSLMIMDYKSYFGDDHVHLGFTGSTGGATALQGVVITEIPPLEWPVHFDLNGGSGTVPDSQYVGADQFIESVVDPEKEGYKFIGWNTQRDGQGTNWDFNSNKMPNRPITLYAQFEEVIEGSPVFVHHEDSNGNEVAPPEELRGMVGETFETNPVSTAGWRLLKMPEYSTGVFSLESQTITYIYERIEGSSVFVHHEDGNGNEVASSEELTGLWGDPFEAKPAIIPGMNVLVYPENISGIFSGESQSVTFIYEVSGGIVVEFPESINFDTTAIQTKDILIQRKNPNLGVKITDTRSADFQQNWVLNLSLDEELHIDGHQIPGAMVYSNEDNLIPLNEGTQEIYSKKEPVIGAIDINWQEDEGLLLLIPGNKALPGEYQGKVLWSLVIGP